MPHAQVSRSDKYASLGGKVFACCSPLWASHYPSRSASRSWMQLNQRRVMSRPWDGGRNKKEKSLLFFPSTGRVHLCSPTLVLQPFIPFFMHCACTPFHILLTCCVLDTDMVALCLLLAHGPQGTVRHDMLACGPWVWLWLWLGERGKRKGKHGIGIFAWQKTAGLSPQRGSAE